MILVVIINVIIYVSDSLSGLQISDYSGKCYSIKIMFQKQTSITSMLARASSIGSGGSSGGSGPTRQGSQNSLFDTFASSAKELMAKERQASQERSFLAQVDKVCQIYFICGHK